jgi:hypothetical protein
MNPRTAAEWIEAHQYCSRRPDVPRILAKEAAKHYAVALRKARPAKPAIRLPRGRRGAPKIKTAQKAKRDLRAELEAYCKAVVFTRDCGSPEAREGACITCRNYRVLQWGHFIPQQKSKWLQYDPRNTGGQCAGCNGPGGRGEVFKYGQAIDARDGSGSAAALQREADAHKWWRPNRVTLQQKLDELQRLYPLRREAPGERLREPVPPLTPPLNPPNLETP